MKTTSFQIVLQEVSLSARIVNLIDNLLEDILIQDQLVLSRLAVLSTMDKMRAREEIAF